MAEFLRQLLHKRGVTAKLPASRQLRLEKKILIHERADLSNEAGITTYKNVVKICVLVRIDAARFA